ncbi:MAG: DNA gyrase inhibitor YacG [Isosphaeraceae bacterium]
MAKRLRSLRCPTCKKAVVAKSTDFPFCSERCRAIDLGKWASGAYVISSPVTDMSEDLENQANSDPDE